MKTIKFRGKDCLNGKWYYGSLYVTEIYGRTQILLPILGCSDVDPETVRQFTSLYDCDGKEIFEGDILDFNGIITEVQFVRGAFAFLVRSNLGDELYGDCRTDLFAKIIGNIYENPDIIPSQ